MISRPGWTRICFSPFLVFKWRNTRGKCLQVLTDFTQCTCGIANTGYLDHPVPSTNPTSNISIQNMKGTWYTSQNIAQNSIWWIKNDVNISNYRNLNLYMKDVTYRIRADDHKTYSYSQNPFVLTVAGSPSSAYIPVSGAVRECGGEYVYFRDTS